MNIEEIGDEIEDYTFDYWSTKLHVSKLGLRRAIQAVGNSATKVRKYLNSGFRLAIKSDVGTIHKVLRIGFQADGFYAVVPYHPAKKGLIVTMPVDYSQTEFVVPFSEMDQYTASGPVKLSIHTSGFVQYSSASSHKILSGFCNKEKAVRGAGLKAPLPVEVTSGPLFGLSLAGLNSFKKLSNEDAEIFDQNDFWNDPNIAHLSNEIKILGTEEWLNTSDKIDPSILEAYHIEIFQLPLHLLKESRLEDNKRLLVTQLPFHSKIMFRHTLRVLEIPGMHFFLGVAVKRSIKIDEYGDSYYQLSGPGCFDDEGNARVLNATYPCPDDIQTAKTKSLDYEQNE